MLASECLVALESVATTANKFLAKEENGKKTCSKSLEGLLPIFRRKLRTSAQRLLEQNWSDESLENGWKNKVLILVAMSHAMCYQLSFD